MLAVLVAAAATSPVPPSLPAAFTVKLIQNGSYGALGQYGLHHGATPAATFFFDSTWSDGTIRQRINSSAGFETTTWVLFTSANQSLNIYAKFFNDCRPLPTGITFGHSFDLHWLPDASFVGNVELPGGLKGSAFGYFDKLSSYNYSAVFHNDELLYVDSTWTGSLPGTGGQSLPQRHTVVPGSLQPVSDLPHSLWEVPVSGCFEKVPPCPDGEVVTTDVYLAHPHAFDYIDDEDTGDAKGDVSFLCLDIINPSSGAFNLYDQVSQWRVEMDTHWGQYQQCNGYPGLCFGLEECDGPRQMNRPPWHSPQMRCPFVAAC